MLTLRSCCGLALVLLTSGLVIAQDKATGKTKGQLPPNWSKLGLSDDQKAKIYKIRSGYKEKAESLEQQLRELREKELSECAQLLTAQQREKLRSLVLPKGLGEPGEKSTEDKKGDKAKSDK